MAEQALDPNFDPSKSLAEQSGTTEQEKKLKALQEDIAQQQDKLKYLQQADYGSLTDEARRRGIALTEKGSPVGGGILGALATGTGLGGLIGGLIGGNQDQKRGAEALRSDILSQLSGQIAGLTKQEGALGGQVRDIKLGRTRAREGFLSDQVNQARIAQEGGIDALLQARLEQIGAQADASRSIVGGEAASRGLLRSSAAADQLGEVSAREFAATGEERLRASEQIAGTRRATNQAIEGIRERRRQAETAQSLQQLESIEQAGFQFDQNQLQQQIDAQINQLQVDAAQGDLFNSLLGGAAGAAAKIFSGGLL